jgi:hypothetical protein
VTPVRKPHEGENPWSATHNEPFSCINHDSNKQPKPPSSSAPLMARRPLQEHGQHGCKCNRHQRICPHLEKGDGLPPDCHSKEKAVSLLPITSGIIGFRSMVKTDATKTCFYTQPIFTLLTSSVDLVRIKPYLAIFIDLRSELLSTPSHFLSPLWRSPCLSVYSGSQKSMRGRPLPRRPHRERSGNLQSRAAATISHLSKSLFRSGQPCRRPSREYLPRRELSGTCDIIQTTVP